MNAIKLNDLKTMIENEIMCQISPFPIEHIYNMVNKNVKGSKYYNSSMLREVCFEVLNELGNYGCVDMISMDLYMVVGSQRGW